MYKNVLRRRSWLILGAALVVGLIAALLAFQYMRYSQAPEASTEPAIETTDVLVASQPIQRGERLSGDVLRQAPWPAGEVPEQAFREVEQVQDRVALRGLVAGELLLPSALSEPTEGGATLTALVPDGKRAISIEVNPVIGVSGFVRPLTRVDVLATRRAGGGESATTRTVLENVTVLAVRKVLDPNEDVEIGSDTPITLLTTPEQAQKVALISDEASFHLSLRNQMDEQAVNPGELSLFELWGGTPAPAQPQQAQQPPPGYAVQTINGEATSSVRVNEGGE